MFQCRTTCAAQIGLLAFIAVATAVGLGCRNSASEHVVLKFWAMGSEGERLRPLLEEFERQNPDIRVDLQQIPWNAAHEKLLTAFAGDALPDVCQLGNTWIPEFVALGSLEDLTSRLKENSSIKASDYFPGAWQCNVLSNALYGIPWYVDTRLLFYRKDILRAAGYDHPPQNWDEWLAVMRAVQDRQPKGDYAILLPINEFEQPMILGMQTGASMLAGDGSYGDFESPEFRKAFDFYVGIFRQGFAPAMSNTRISNVWQEFDRGTFAMYIGGPWNVTEFRKRMGPKKQDLWTTAPWPAPTGKAPGVSNAGGASLVIFRKSPRKGAAWKLIAFLSQTPQQVEFFKLASNLPARQAAWEDPALVGDRELAAFREQFANVRPAPMAPEWEQIATGELAKSAEAAISGELTVDAALARLNDRVDQILEKRRWMLAQHKGQEHSEEQSDLSP